MPDSSLNPQNTTVAGMTGSGKTTFVIRLLLNRPNVACRFIFDDEERTAPRLRLKPAYTLAECEAALATRWVVFNPSRMFPFEDGDRSLLDAKRRAFRWFCKWIFDVSANGPGEKIVSLPEIWRFCTPDSIPPEFASLMQMGRELGTHIVCDTQRPELVNGSVLGATTELIVFKLQPTGQSDCPVKTVRRLAPNVPAIESPGWPMGKFWALNRLSGGTAEGKLF